MQAHPRGKEKYGHCQDLFTFKRLRYRCEWSKTGHAVLNERVFFYRDAIEKTHGIVALVLIIALCVVVYNARISAEAVNGLNGEAGIIKKDGTIIPLQERQFPLALWQVNSVDVDEGDYVYWKFWLDVKATGNAGQLTSAS